MPMHATGSVVGPDGVGLMAGMPLPESWYEERPFMADLEQLRLVVECDSAACPLDHFVSIDVPDWAVPVEDPAEVVPETVVADVEPPDEEPTVIEVGGEASRAHDGAVDVGEEG